MNWGSIDTREVDSFFIGAPSSQGGSACEGRRPIGRSAVPAIYWLIPHSMYSAIICAVIAASNPPPAAIEEPAAAELLPPRDPPREVLALSHVSFGVGNQLLAFQNLVDKAAAEDALLHTPVLFLCDKTTDIQQAWGGCEGEGLPLQDFFQLSTRVLQRLTTRAPTTSVDGSDAFRMRDYATTTTGLDALRDFEDFGASVTEYGEWLRQRQCAPGCVVVQYRTGSDWELYAQKHPEASFRPSEVNHTVAQLRRAFPGHGCLLMTPPSTRIDGLISRCAKFTHHADAHPILQLYGEIYVASRAAAAFVYSPHSSARFEVRRFKRSQVSTFPMIFKMIHGKAHVQGLVLEDIDGV